jgi:hypothetical protein
MTNKEQNISPKEASAALQALQQFQQDNNAAIRPPLWLSIVLGAWYALLTFSNAKMAHENLWALGLIISVIGFLLSIAFYLYTSRLLGIKPRLKPRNTSQLKFDLLAGLFYVTVFFASRYFTGQGIELAAYLGAMINGVGLGYLLHKYSALVNHHA